VGREPHAVASPMELVYELVRLRPPDRCVRPGETLMLRCARRPVYLSLLLGGVLVLAAYAPQANAGRSALATATAGSSALIGQDVADFYRGKTITVLVGFTPGGGFDATARILAKYLGRYIPGEPNVIVENMPGAGSLTAANHLNNVAPPDGLTIGTFDEGQLIRELVGEEGVQFDGRRFGWLGSVANETTACTLRTDSLYTTVDALRRSDLPPVVVGGIPGTNLEHFPKMLNATLGMHFRVVSEYSGTAAIRLATESGEVQGMCVSYESLLVTNWVETDFVRIPIYQSEAEHEAGSAVSGGRSR
jgi:tripartite-type tricarboxylate transporter receptor subunit TctC